jgi:hypothetical protein
VGRPQDRDYRAYMLRLRRAGGDQPTWRASLDEIATGERYVFTTVDELLTWLREETDRAHVDRGQRPDRE